MIVSPRYYTINRVIFQLRRAGVIPLAERLTGIEARLEKLEGKRVG